MEVMENNRNRTEESFNTSLIDASKLVNLPSFPVNFSGLLWTEVARAWLVECCWFMVLEIGSKKLHIGRFIQCV
jgi:hypothetical protein